MTGGMSVYLFCCSLAFCQLKDVGLTNPLEKYKQVPTRPKAETKALEGVIDPAEYVLGAGDRLEIAVWGDIEMTFDIFVTPDGTISIPGIGPVHVAGNSIAEAEKLLHEKSRRSYPGARISLKLIEIRSMKVSISGAVAEPGVYELTSIDRLSALIFLAGGFLEPESRKSSGQEEETVVAEERSRSEKKSELDVLDREKAAPSRRKIRIVDRTGGLKVVDYLRYEKAGDRRSNPVLSDGSQVHVPLMDRDVGVIHIFGAVKDPGEYEYVDGDRLLDILEIAGGVRTDALLNDIEVTSFLDDDDSTCVRRVDLTDPNADPRGPLLKVDDRIFVRSKPDYHPRYYVEIRGEVKYPGVYPIEDNITRLTEVIEACGGFTGRADVSGGSVERTALEKVDDPEYQRLQKIPVGEMSDMEYEYFKLKSREIVPDVIVDFNRLFRKNDTSCDVVLRDRDVIEIPTLTPTVNVIGKVRSPGLVKFSDGADYKYYIEKAGGFSWNAKKNKIRLIKAHGGVWERLDNKSRIEIGDTIFIPEKKDTNWWEYTKEILLVLSQLATIVVVVQSL